jgi:hypothetical protein
MRHALELRELFDAFSPDGLDFGKNPAAVIDRVANLARNLGGPAKSGP